MKHLVETWLATGNLMTIMLRLHAVYLEGYIYIANSPPRLSSSRQILPMNNISICAIGRKASWSKLKHTWLHPK